QHILYLQDEAGDENWHVFVADVGSGETRDLTPFKGVAARIQEVSPKFPDALLVTLNKRDPKLHDLYRLDLDGNLKLMAENPPAHGFVSFVTDPDFAVRFAVRVARDGGEETYRPAAGGDWELFLRVPMEDAISTEPVGFNKSGDVLYMKDSRGKDTAA